MHPNNLISAIRDSFDNAEYVYTNGSCYKLFNILKVVFVDAEAYYDPIEGHVYTKINNQFYDINGVQRVNKSKLVKMRSDPTLMKKVHRWHIN